MNYVIITHNVAKIENYFTYDLYVMPILGLSLNVRATTACLNR